MHHPLVLYLVSAACLALDRRLALLDAKVHEWVDIHPALVGRVVEVKHVAAVFSRVSTSIGTYAHSGIGYSQRETIEAKRGWEGG